MLESAFHLFGLPVTWLELWAALFGFIGIALMVFENAWGWPLSIASSVLYVWLFYVNKLYGEAGLNVFFAAIGLWGWWQWLYGAARDGGSLHIVRLSHRQVFVCAAVWLLSWLVLGVGLERFTDTDVPWFDAFPTAGSVIGQVLLARKYVENWMVWIVVNAVSIPLFAFKGLWPTVVLYGVLLVLAVLGALRWRAAMRLAA